MFTQLCAFFNAICHRLKKRIYNRHLSPFFIIEFNTGNFFQTTVYLKSHGNCFFLFMSKNYELVFFFAPGFETLKFI